MADSLSLFERYLTEAPGDPPDMGNFNNSVPDMPADASTQEGPPDMGNMDGGLGDDMGGMPDLGGFDDGGFDMGMDGMGMDDGSGLMDPNQQQQQQQQQEEPLQLDDKVNAIMNQQLYQRYLALLNTIGGQLTMMRNNSDVLHTLSPESIDGIESLKKLDENVRLYIRNTFMHEGYSKNLLFFNKCLNLLKLLNNVFDENIRKGIRNFD